MSKTTELEKVWMPEAERVRFETYGDVEALAESMNHHGQITPILVRPFRRDEFPDAPTGIYYVVVDGGRRFTAMRKLAEEGIGAGSMEPGIIRIDSTDATEDPFEALLQEFYANEEREDFSWSEKARFVRRLHEDLTKRAEANDKKWGPEATAVYLNMSRSMIYKYLELTEDEEIFQSDVVQDADTFNAAVKKVKIAKEKARRKMKASLRKNRKATEDSSPESDEPLTPKDYFSRAQMIVSQGDCREWIRERPDEHFDWIHWDPMYGGEQAGGARTIHKNLDDSEDYARSLMADCIPEIYRTLAPGGWLVIWFHQSQREWLREQLESAGLWVNPYECIWYKKNRVADGHEITRYLVNAYEPFFLAGRPPEDSELVFANSSGQNVFPVDMPTRSARRHPMEKPAALLEKILHVISLPGEHGADLSCGSGSIVEAAIRSRRTIEAVELDEGYYLTSLEATAQVLEVMGADAPAVAELPDSLSI